MAFDLRGLLEDENFLIGAGLLTAGAKGQSAGEAIFPSIINAAKVKKTFADTAKTTKSVFDVELGENVLRSDKDIAANPERFKPAKKGESNSLSKEGLKLYKISENISVKDFPAWFKTLSKSQQNIYNNEVRGKIGNIEQIGTMAEDMNVKAQETALPVPMKDGKINTSELLNGFVYSLNGQLRIWDEKKQGFIELKDR